jgi:hypothetical protein
MAYAGKKEKKYSKIFYQDISLETPELTINVEEALSMDDATKIKIKLVNKTSDYIIFKGSETSFIVEGKAYHPVEKSIIIAPNESGSRVLHVKGTVFLVTSMDIKMEGFYRAPAEGEAIQAPVFRLPAAENDFTAGPFHVVQKENERKTDMTMVKFEISYNGTKMGIFDPAKITLRMPNGKEFANMKEKRKPMLFEKGETDHVTAKWINIDVSNGDMQVVEMTILWKAGFREVTPSKLDAVTAKLEIDREKSK